MKHPITKLLEELKSLPPEAQTDSFFEYLRAAFGSGHPELCRYSITEDGKIYREEQFVAQLKDEELE